MKNMTNETIANTNMCNSLSLSVELPKGGVEKMVWCSTSLNCCAVVVWFADMSCDSALLTTSLQACKPSNHVWSTSPPLPQWLYQAPPGAQQLSLPDFLMVLHLEHTEPIVVTAIAVTTDVGKWVLGQSNEETAAKLVSLDKHGRAFRQSWAYLCRHAGLRSTCAQRWCYRHFHTS